MCPEIHKSKGTGSQCDELGHGCVFLAPVGGQWTLQVVFIQAQLEQRREGREPSPCLQPGGGARVLAVHMLWWRQRPPPRARWVWRRGLLCCAVL